MGPSPRASEFTAISREVQIIAQVVAWILGSIILVALGIAGLYLSLVAVLSAI